MYSIGIDLHKKSITVCVMIQNRKIVTRVTLPCRQPDRIRAFFMQYQPFTTVMEATGAYEWLFELLEPLAERVVLAHPKKLRIIAESTRMSDRLDATVLAQFLTLDMIPEAYRPTPREREHRQLCFVVSHWRGGTRGVFCRASLASSVHLTIQEHHAHSV